MDKEQLLKDAIEKCEGEIMTLQVMVMGLKTELVLGRYREQTPPISLSPSDKIKADNYVKETVHDTIKDILLKDYALEKSKGTGGKDD